MVTEERYRIGVVDEAQVTTMRRLGLGVTKLACPPKIGLRDGYRKVRQKHGRRAGNPPDASLANTGCSRATA